MVLFVLCKLILQSRMCSHSVGLYVGFLVGPFVHFYTSCVQTAKTLARLHECAGLPDPSLVAYVISTIISWAGSFDDLWSLFIHKQVYVFWGVAGLQERSCLSNHIMDRWVEL